MRSRACSTSARAARARSRAQIVAVTGSAGKTTTKEAIRTVLAAAGETHASIKSFNNHWGVPLMLARHAARGAVRRVRDRHEPSRRDHAADAAGAAACRGDHDRRGGASRVLQLGRRHRRAPRRRSSPGSSRAARRSSTPITSTSTLLFDAARKAGVANIVTYGFGDAPTGASRPSRAAGDRTMARVAHDGETLRADLAGAGPAHGGQRRRGAGGRASTLRRRARGGA